MNPANLFRGNSKTNTEPAASAHPDENLVQVASAKPEPQPVPSYSRYSYHNPRKPGGGNRGAAEKDFAEGSRQQQAGQLSEAAQAYERAIQDDPVYFDPYYNLGVVSVRSGRLSQALTTYETALAIQPESHDARFNFALALKQANYPIDAANELEKLIAKFPKDANAHYALANIYSQQLREPAKARPHYEKVLEVDPGYSQAYAIHDWLWANPP
jgi:tetratricopeptide (TPR) repeat protein